MSKKTKIIIISCTITIILLCIIVAVLNSYPNNEENISNYIESKVVTNIVEMRKLDVSKPSIVLFYANYCKNCHEFAPIFKKLQKDLAKNYNFVMLDTDDPNNFPLTIGNVYTIPTLCIFDPEIGNKVHIPLNAIRTYGRLKGEFERYTRIRGYIDIQKAKTEHLTLMEEYTKKLQASK